MARHKDFDEEQALRGAIAAFGRRGFAATSTDELMVSMGVGRQSMYDTFGDKRTLFLRALRLYAGENAQAIAGELRKSGSPLANIRGALMKFAERNDISAAEGCMGVNALCEFGLHDAEVLEAMQGEGVAKTQRRLLLSNLRRARIEGELAEDADIVALADFFEMTVAGLRLAARYGKSKSELRAIIRVACRAFC